MALDPHTATREQFTRQSLDIPLPAGAHKDWLESVNKCRALVEKLAYHPAMAPNLSQTYMTPAANKNKIYFMWDFVSRILVDPEFKNGVDGAYNDVIGRMVMAEQLILDTKPGMLDMMTESQYSEQKGKHPAFGEEILALVRGS